MTWAAAPEIVLAHAGNSVRLRPSLKAAVQLERMHDGFATLFRKLSELDTRTVVGIITAAATDPEAARQFLVCLGERPLREVRHMQGPLLGLCQSLIPVPDEDTPEITTNEAMPLTWADAYRRLYGYGTGWLGWTPAETWAATPDEITRAFQAHCDKLRAVHGGNDEDEGSTSTADTRNVAQIIEQGADPTLDRAGLHALQGLRSVRE